MTSPQRSKFKSAAQTGVIALASVLAAAAWSSFMRSEAPGYDQRITPAAWRFAR
jgi:hypothetical protein